MSDATAGVLEIRIVYKPVKGRRMTLFTSSSPTLLVAVRQHLVQEIVAHSAELAVSDPVLAEVLRSETPKGSGVLRMGAERQLRPSLQRLK